MTTVFQYPPRLALVLDLARGEGALLIERRGIIQLNLGGRVLLVAYRSIGIWVVEYPISGDKVVVPVSEVNALPPGPSA